MVAEKVGRAVDGGASGSRDLTRRQVVALALAGTLPAILGGVATADAKYSSTYCKQLHLDVVAQSQVVLTLDVNGGTLVADTEVPPRWVLLDPSEDGTSDRAEVTRDSDDKYGILPGYEDTSGFITMQWHDFGGWYYYYKDGETDKEVPALEFTALCTKENHTLTAKWYDIESRVTYALTTGATGGEKKPHLAIVGQTFTVSAPTRKGYTFAGWEVSKGLDYATARWGASADTLQEFVEGQLCFNGASGEVTFYNINVTGDTIGLTAIWVKA